MAVITVAQQKGGAGKTTLVAGLAVLLAERFRVAVLDSDAQHSLARWHALRAAQPGARPIHLSDIAGWRLAGELSRLRGAHEMLLIDSPPRIDSDTRIAIRAADLVLVPIQPSLPDLWAAEETLKLAASERRNVRIVLNRAPASGRLRDQVTDEIARRDWPMLTATLGNRIGFATAFARGLGVSEAAPRSLATTELQAVLAEIEEIL